MRSGVPAIRVRPVRSEDFAAMIAICERVYPESKPWQRQQLESHLELFPEGQLVAERTATAEVVGFASSLIVHWDDYAIDATWREWTDGGYFTNHDPGNGGTLYGAEVMVDPLHQRRGVGKALYRERFALARRLGLRRIRAGARLRGYHRYAHRMSPGEYLLRVVRGELRDATLSFQIREGFRALGVVGDYLKNDPESMGYAAIIEWLNPEFDEAGTAPGGAGSVSDRPEQPAPGDDPAR